MNDKSRGYHPPAVFFLATSNGYDTMTAVGKQHESGVMTSFIENVKQAMIDLNISQQQLAEMSGVARPSINRILANKEGVTLERAEKIAAALGKTIAFLDSRKKVRKSA